MPGDLLDKHFILQGPKTSQRPKTALIGCGGTGCNLIVEGDVKKTDMKIAISSEPAVLKGLKGAEKLLVDAGRVENDARSIVKASRLTGTDTEKRLRDFLDKKDMAFIVAGLGGSTGGWTGVMAARAAQYQRCTSICVVSEPFTVEGRKEIARSQLTLLMEYADGVLVIPNDMIITEAPNLPIAKAFNVMNSVLASPINLLINSLGKDDIDLLKTCLEPSRIFSLDVAEWSGDNATYSIVEHLSKSRWLSLKGRTVKSAILLAEGHLLHDDLTQLGREFSRLVGKDAILVLGNADPGGKTLRVTAIVGF